MLFCDWNGQPLNTVGRVYITPIPITLLVEMFMLFQHDFLVGKEGTEIFQTGEKVEVDEDAGHWLLVASRWQITQHRKFIQTREFHQLP